MSEEDRFVYYSLLVVAPLVGVMALVLGLHGRLTDLLSDLALAASLFVSVLLMAGYIRRRGGLS
jgi:hypothetical protein